MTATSSDRGTVREAGGMAGHEVKAATTIPQGVMVEIDSAGYAINAAGGAGSFFAGVSAANKTAGETLECYTEGVFHFVCSGLAITDVGKMLYVADNQTVTLTPGNVPCGTLAYYVSATDAPVKILTQSGVGAILVDHESRIAALEA